MCMVGSFLSVFLIRKLAGNLVCNKDLLMAFNGLINAYGLRDLSGSYYGRRGHHDSNIDMGFGLTSKQSWFFKQDQRTIEQPRLAEMGK